MDFFWKGRGEKCIEEGRRKEVGKLGMGNLKDLIRGSLDGSKGIVGIKGWRENSRETSLEEERGVFGKV